MPSQFTPITKASNHRKLTASNSNPVSSNPLSNHDAVSLGHPKVSNAEQQPFNPFYCGPPIIHQQFVVPHGALIPQPYSASLRGSQDEGHVNSSSINGTIPVNTFLQATPMYTNDIMVDETVAKAGSKLAAILQKIPVQFHHRGEHFTIQHGSTVLRISLSHQQNGSIALNPTCLQGDAKVYQSIVNRIGEQLKA